MALRAPLFSPNLHPKSLKSQTHLSSFTSSIRLNTGRRRRSQISCCAKKLSDVELAIDLAAELAKMNKPKEAMLKSRELLFGEFCQYLGLRDEKVKKKWRKMDEVEKMGCVQKFVSEWSLSFHPLSAKSVKEMVEEHLEEENPTVVSSPPFMFPSLMKILGFLEDKQNGEGKPSEKATRQTTVCSESMATLIEVSNCILFCKFHCAGGNEFSIAAPSESSLCSLMKSYQPSYWLKDFRNRIVAS